MNRTFLFLLVVGLFVVAWQRNKIHSEAQSGTTVPAPRTNAFVAPLTNIAADRALVSVEQSIHK